MAIAPPTFVAEYESAWDNSIALAISTTVDTGDVLACFGGVHNGSTQLNPPSGGGLTFTEQEFLKPSTSYCTGYLWSADATSAQTFTTSVTKVVDDGNLLGANLLRFSGSDGIGASASSSASGAAPTLQITTTQDNSAIVMLVLDWNGTSGTRTYDTATAGAFTERSYFQSGAWTVQGGFYADAGLAGLKTIGITAPAGQKYTILAMEVLGTEETGGGVTGTIVEWNSTADPAPDTTVGAVTYPGGDVIEIAGGAGSANVRFNTDALTVGDSMAARFYAKFDEAWATGTVHLMSWFADSGSTLLGRLAVTNQGRLRGIDASGADIGEALPIMPLDTWLRYEVSWGTGGALNVDVYTTTLTQVLHLGVSLSSAQWQAVWFGHTNDSQNPPTLSLANIKITDSAADSPIGARPGDAPTLTPVYHIKNGLLAPMTITML